MSWNPPKISDEGLKSYLNRTADKHDGLTYSDFKRLIGYRERQSKSAVSINGMARLFKVDYRTLKNWIEIYYHEKEAVK